MLLLLLSTILSVVLSYEYHKCDEVCIKYYSNLTQSLAGGENPFDQGSIKRPIFSRKRICYWILELERMADHLEHFSLGFTMGIDIVALLIGNPTTIFWPSIAA